MTLKHLASAEDKFTLRSALAVNEEQIRRDRPYIGSQNLYVRPARLMDFERGSHGEFPEQHTEDPDHGEEVNNPEKMTGRFARLEGWDDKIFWCSGTSHPHVYVFKDVDGLTGVSLGLIEVSLHINNPNISWLPEHAVVVSHKMPLIWWTKKDVKLSEIDKRSLSDQIEFCRINKEMIYEKGSKYDGGQVSDYFDVEN